VIVHKFRELKVRQRAMDLVVEVYIGRRLGYCDDQQVNALLQEADEIAAMIVGLSRSLSEK
jgi:hypothetical protein